MYSKSKILWLAATVATVSALAFIGCQKKEDRHHAPVCPYGQVLSYEQAGWTCRYITFNNNQFGQFPQQQPNPQQQVQTGVLTPPLSLPGANCNIGAQPVPGQPVSNAQQTLVSWTNIGLWTCMYDDLLRPGGSDSPVAPVTRGGETCTLGYGAGMYQQQYGYQQQQYGQFGMTGNMVSCSTGFTCMPAQAAAQQIQPGQPGYQQYQQQPYYGGGYNQTGVCMPYGTALPGQQIPGQTPIPGQQVPGQYPNGFHY
jgi:hypothetical protein